MATRELNTGTAIRQPLAVRWALSQNVKSPFWRFTLLLLALHANEHHRAHLFREQMAQMIGCSLRTVDIALKGLEDDGLIVRRRHGADPSTYALQIESGSRP